MCAWHQTEAQNGAADGAAERRALSLLLEGAAVNLLQVDEAAFRSFRSAILRNSIRLTEPQSESDLLASVAAIVQEFGTYRVNCETIVESRRKDWRQMVGMLMQQLALRDGIDEKSESWMKITVELTSATTSTEIEQLNVRLQQLFDSSGEEIAARNAEESEQQDRTSSNDNAAGLRGGGAAIEHVRGMIAESRPGYIGLFRLNCLDVVGERFGMEGIQDCLMTVSAFLIQNMRAEDAVYHWSESSLLAVCDRKVREDMLSAELNRVLARNREFTITIQGRAIMLRIPVDLQLFPVSHFASADDLRNLNIHSGRADRLLSDRLPYR